MPASSFCGLPTSVSRLVLSVLGVEDGSLKPYRPSLKSSAIAGALGAGQVALARAESCSTSDQSSSESFEARSDQISSKVDKSWIKLGVELGCDVRCTELPANDAGRCHTCAGLSAWGTSFLFNVIILEVGE